MARTKQTRRGRPRAPRRPTRKLVLVRELGTLRCWAAQLLDWSVTGCKVAGFPQRGELTAGTRVELIEGLDSDSFEKIAPVLSESDPARFEAAVDELRPQLSLRRSAGKVVRTEPANRHFAIKFNEVTEDGRRYPVAHGQNAPVKANFTYKDSLGVYTVEGNLTPGAAIDLAKDVVNDTRQCIVIIDLSKIVGVNRIAVEKFHTRLHSDLDDQDVAHALAVVSPEEWVRAILGKVQTYPTLEEAKQSIRASLNTEFERTDEEAASEPPPDEPAGDQDKPSDKPPEEKPPTEPAEAQGKPSDKPAQKETPTEPTDAPDKPSDDKESK